MLFDREREILQDLMDLADIKESLARIEAALAVINDKEGKIMSAQQDFSNDVEALATFLNTTLPTALAAIQQELADQGVTDVSSLDELVNTSLPAVQSTLSSIASPASASGTTPAPVPTPGTTPSGS
jgi:hypothetical protein